MPLPPIPAPPPPGSSVASNPHAQSPRLSTLSDNATLAPLTVPRREPLFRLPLPRAPRTRLTAEGIAANVADIAPS